MKRDFASLIDRSGAREGGYESQFLAAQARQTNHKCTNRANTIPMSLALGKNMNALFDGSKLSLVNCNITVIDKIPAQIAVKVKTLYLSNNNLSSLSGIGQFANVVTLSAAHNLIRFLDDLSPLSNLIHLERLSLEGNTVVSMPYYREYLIAMCSRLQSVDGIKVTKDERDGAIIAAHKMASVFEQMRINELQNCILTHCKWLMRCHLEMKALILGRFQNLRGPHLPTPHDCTSTDNRVHVIVQALRGGVYHFLQTAQAKDFDRVAQNLARRAYLGIVRNMTANDRLNLSSQQCLLWDNAIAECIRYQQMMSIRLIEACCGTATKSLVKENSFIAGTIKNICFDNSSIVDGATLIYNVPSHRPLKCAAMSPSLLPPKQVEPQDTLEVASHVPTVCKVLTDKMRSDKTEANNFKLKAPLCTSSLPSQNRALDEETVNGNAIEAISSFLSRLGSYNDTFETHGWKDVHVEHFEGPHRLWDDDVMRVNIEGLGPKDIKETVQGLVQSLSLQQREESQCSNANIALRKQLDLTKKILKINIQRSLSDLRSMKSRIQTYDEEIKLCLRWVRQEHVIIANVEEERKRVNQMKALIKKYVSSKDVSIKETNAAKSKSALLIRSISQAKTAIIDTRLKYEKTEGIRAYLRDLAQTEVAEAFYSRLILRRYFKILKSPSTISMLVLKFGRVKCMRRCFKALKLGGVISKAIYCIRNLTHSTLLVAMWKRWISALSKVKILRLVTKRQNFRRLSFSLTAWKTLLSRTRTESDLEARHDLLLEKWILRRTFEGLKSISKHRSIMLSNANEFSATLNHSNSLKVEASTKLQTSTETNLTPIEENTITDLHNNETLRFLKRARTHLESKISLSLQIYVIRHWANLTNATSQWRKKRHKLGFKKLNNLAISRKAQILNHSKGCHHFYIRSISTSFQSFIAYFHDNINRRFRDNCELRYCIQRKIQISMLEWHSLSKRRARDRMKYTISSQHFDAYAKWRAFRSLIFNRRYVLSKKYKSDSCIPRSTSECGIVRYVHKMENSHPQCNASILKQSLNNFFSDSDEEYLKPSFTHASHFSCCLLTFISRWKSCVYKKKRLKGLALKLLHSKSRRMLRWSFMVFCHHHIRSLMRRNSTVNASFQQRIHGGSSCCENERQLESLEHASNFNSFDQTCMISTSLVPDREKLLLLQDRMHSLLSILTHTSSEIEDASAIISDIHASISLLEGENNRLKLKITTKRDTIAKLSVDSGYLKNAGQSKDNYSQSQPFDDRIECLFVETTSLRQDIEECYRIALQSQSEARRHQDILSASASATIEFINKCRDEILDVEKTVADLTSKRLTTELNIKECRDCLDISLGNMADMALANEHSLERLRLDEARASTAFQAIEEEEMALRVELDNLSNELLKMKAKDPIRSNQSLVALVSPEKGFELTEGNDNSPPQCHSWKNSGLWKGVHHVSPQIETYTILSARLKDRLGQSSPFVE